MKKLLFTVLTGVILCAASFIGYTIFDTKTMSSRDILVMQNLEVLSRAEEGDGKWYGEDWQPCPIIQQIIVHSGCGGVSAGTYTGSFGTILAKLDACGGRYTLVGEHEGQKSYCKWGWGWGLICWSEDCR